MNFSYEPNKIFAINGGGEIIAEVTFPEVKDNVVNINHTFVDPTLRGQGVASLLLQEAYQTIKNQNKKAIMTCSYAVKWFEQHTECSDILSK
ncbi:GNAT family N-acetyltransferase [Cellulosilyticum sp. I15G10I2]|uniref:GNAT family N-acetyltransferase n=1 Tax=Cellulosilyticum sp. I15G10I2 TaxID=1892843 RepID=UPI00085BF117|nr:GNAT family N-acetyltransferase [Cellulosilyticum sp. I15G10I2]